MNLMVYYYKFKLKMKNEESEQDGMAVNDNFDQTTDQHYQKLNQYDKKTTMMVDRMDDSLKTMMIQSEQYRN